MSESFSYTEVEAALCVWECINDWTYDDPKRSQPDWVKLREDVGSTELRHQSIALGQWCLKIYDLCIAEDRDFFDGLSYDWEVIPMIMQHARDEAGPVIYQGELPSPETIAPLVMAEVDRDRHR